MSLSNSQLLLLKALGEYLNKKNIKAYLVGGCVRDLLMRYDVKDLDLMLEADATDVLKQLYLSQDFSYQCTKPILFKKYKTAKVRFSKPEQDFLIELDFSSARKEVYPEIASNPVCSAANLNEDLARRDFTINALAYSLYPFDLVAAIDLYGGVLDISNKIVKVLHPMSFRDDPARLIRAARFITRFGFSFDSETERLFVEARDSKYASFLGERRAHDELRKALTEDCWKEVFSFLEKFKVLYQLSPLLSTAWAQIDSTKLQGDTWEERLDQIAQVLPADDVLELRKKFGIKYAY